MESLPPQYFYKYRAVDKNTISNLLNETLYFANYEQLNDPHEFFFNKSPDNDTLETVEKYLQLKIYLESSDKYWGESLENVKKLKNNMEDKDLLKAFHEELTNTNDEIRKLQFIFCCAENTNIRKEDKDENIKMWDQYAKKHSGICIEYESIKKMISLRDNIFTKASILPLLKKVIYKDFCPYLFTDNDKMNFSEILFQKFSQWQYENEWRFLGWKDKSGDSLQKGNIPLTECFSRISSIIFGVRTPEQDKKDIIKIFEHKSEKPDFKQAVWDDKESFLRIVKYVPNL